MTDAADYYLKWKKWASSTFCQLRQRSILSDGRTMEEEEVHLQTIGTSSASLTRFICSRYWSISSKLFGLLTAKTQRKPSPVRMYWSRIALKRREIRFFWPVGFAVALCRDLWISKNLSPILEFLISKNVRRKTILISFICSMISQSGTEI